MYADLAARDVRQAVVVRQRRSDLVGQRIAQVHLPVADVDRLAFRVAEAESDLDAGARALRDDSLDLRATLSQMADIAGEVLGEADEASLRDFYAALGLRVDYDPSTRIASATVIPAGAGGGSVRVRGGLEPPDNSHKRWATGR